MLSLSPMGPGFFIFFQDEPIEPQPQPQPKIPGTGGGRYDPGYVRQREDALKETRRRRILQEDEEVVALIMAMVTEGLI